MYNSFFKEKLKRFDALYDEKAGMLTFVRKEQPGYHTRIQGTVHPTLSAASYAELVYHLREEALYPRAERCLRSLIELQDKDPQSKTYGLWSYDAEESLSQMRAPDYNFADFICRHLAYILKMRADRLDASLKKDLTDTVLRGARCSIRRNVGADYTNITMMSSNTIIAAAEIANDKEMLDFGRARLAHFLEYNAWNGTFSEYNSPTYTPLAIEEISRMLLLFEDKECRRLAEELNDIAWRLLASHFVANNRQYMPPHLRAYHNITPSATLSLIYLGTNGKYGMLREEDIAMTLLPYHCPEKYWHFFEPIENEREITELYYRKNTIRYPDEDVTIIRNFDSPDLLAYSYATPDYSLGAFRVSDTWVQRHNCMLIFGDKDAPTTLRLQCIKRNTEEKDYPVYDTCMGFVTADMKKNVILGQCGFTTDHGDFHYILDKCKNGVYEMEELSFCFTLGGNTEGVTVEKTEKGYRFAKGETYADIAFYGGYFDGKPILTHWDEDEKKLSAVCYGGERKKIAFKELKESILTFTLSVNAVCDTPVIREQNGIRYAQLKDLCVASYLRPTAYDNAVALSAPTPHLALK